MDPARFVFLDETGATTDMARRYGRSPKGVRLVAAVPKGHWKTTTCIAGLRTDGIIAPLVLDGPMTGEAFLAYVEQFLAPALEPGDVVVLDTLGAHKVDGVRLAIARAGAHILYLPPYSPDLNPIEQLFAKLEHHPLAWNRVSGGSTRIKMLYLIEIEQFFPMSICPVST